MAGAESVYTPRWYDHPNKQAASGLPERQQIIKIFVPKSVFPSQHYRRVLLLSDFEALLSVTSNPGFSPIPTPYPIPSAWAPRRLVLLQSNFLSRELESDSVLQAETERHCSVRAVEVGRLVYTLMGDEEATPSWLVLGACSHLWQKLCVSLGHMTGIWERESFPIIETIIIIFF